METTSSPTSVVESSGTPVRTDVPSRVCLVSISGGLYAIDLRNVREVFAVEAVTPVPGMGTVLAGVTNLRGVIIPLVDLRGILGLSGTGASAFAVVVRHGDYQVGVLVDQSPEIMTVQSDQFMPAPQNGSDSAHPFVSAVLRVEDRLGGVLEVPTLLARVETEGAA
jgi:purine-binding chemotaxis protein CheW